MHRHDPPFVCVRAETIGDKNRRGLNTLSVISIPQKPGATAGNTVFGNSGRWIRFRSSVVDGV